MARAARYPILRIIASPSGGRIPKMVTSSVNSSGAFFAPSLEPQTGLATLLLVGKCSVPSFVCPRSPYPDSESVPGSSRGHSRALERLRHRSAGRWLGSTDETGSTHGGFGLVSVPPVGPRSWLRQNAVFVARGGPGPAA